MLVVVTTNDRLDNARRVVGLGVARPLAQSDHRAGRLRAEFSALFHGAEHAERAREVAEEVFRKRACDAVAMQLEGGKDGRRRAMDRFRR